MGSRAELIQAELRRREGVLGSLFPVQRAAVLDPAPLRAWQCARRAGKTTGAMAEFFHDGRNSPWCEYAYIALTATSAKQIAWPILRKLNAEHHLHSRFRESEMRVELSSGAGLTLYGANRPDWMDRLYGQKLKKVWIDEAAFFSVDMRYLIEDVLEPTVTDLEGQITLMSKPGHLNRGYFYDVCHDRRKGWNLHKWDYRDNPHIRAQVERLIARKVKDNPDLYNDPTFRRNWLNEWVEEVGLRVYRFEAEHNGIEQYIAQPGDRYIMSLDLGWGDATGFSVICWSEQRPDVIELESYREREMMLDAVAARCRMYEDAYPGLHMVGDPDHRHGFEELRRRYDLPISIADKSEKRYWIDQINNDYLAGRIKIVAPESSPHVEEMMGLTWLLRPNGNQVEYPGRPNDCCDAFAYGFREARHFLHRPPRPEPTRGTAEWWDREAERIEEELEQQYLEQQESDDW